MKGFALLFAIVFCLLAYSASACDNSTITISNTVDNLDGTYTYTLDLTTELGALDVTFYGFALIFLSSDGTPTVTGFPATIGNGDLSLGNLSETLVGLTGNNINSVVNDTDWDSYEGLANVLSYEDGSIFGAASDDIGWSMQVTVSGCVETILFDSSVNSGSIDCIKTASTGFNCLACSIDALASGAQSSCDPGTNTFTQEVVITFNNPPATGTLDVNGQNFSIGTSPQTVLLTGLLADGLPVDITAIFSDDSGCSLSSLGLFTAPASCTTPCNPDNGTWD